jgi:hypothetical protein
MSDCLKCKYEALITDLGYNWDTIYGGIYNYRINSGSMYENFNMGLSNGATVEVHSKSDEVEYDEYEGRTQDMWVALKVTEPNGDILFFRKTGSADSYGNVTWNGLFQQVKAVEKMVTVFEPSFEVI